jgi:hypothetical protein
MFRRPTARSLVTKNELNSSTTAASGAIRELYGRTLALLHPAHTGRQPGIQLYNCRAAVGVGVTTGYSLRQIQLRFWRARVFHCHRERRSRGGACAGCVSATFT